MWRLVSGPKTKGHPLLETVNDCVGRQCWEYDPAAGTPEQRAQVEKLRAEFTAHRHEKRDSDDAFVRLWAQDRVQAAEITVPTGELPPKDAVSKDRLDRHIEAAVKFYECLQEDDGFWPGDYGGPMFLMPGMVIALYVTKHLDSALCPESKREMIRYLRNHQNRDGGWGLHIEGPSGMFGSALNYAALRILGVAADDPVAVSGRTWIQKKGGATFSPAWGKFWLAVLGVYKWEGLNPLPPEMWLLPYSKLTGVGIMHPGRFWCHCRLVYLPMSYVYGVRHELEIEPSALVQALREELYAEPYDSMDWNACRNKILAEDNYYPHPPIQDVVWWALYQVEPYLKGSFLRKRALRETIKHIHYEDENTRYVDIGPVNKAMNMLCCWLEDPDSQAFKKHLVRLPDYLWVAEDGMKMQGYNGSQLWDTAFALQAIIATKQTQTFKKCLKLGHDFLHKNQVRKEADAPLEAFYRHISLGAWPFSIQDHGWPISDCTSEALKAALLLRQLPSEDVGPAVPDEWLFRAINVVLSYQNENGGMATYERSRSYPFIEAFNPSETFGDIIIDYSCTECTSACIQSLGAFRKVFPSHRSAEIETAIQRARRFILGEQREDGSWYGSWGVCFTYGTWFGLTALSVTNDNARNSEAARRGCTFLLDKQRDDGGWGESFLSCQDKVYSQLEGESHVVNTAWAMLGLFNAGYDRINPEPLHKAAKFLLRMQRNDGDWPQQHISGVFNRNCMITYTNYRYIFPIWALALYSDRVAVM